MSSSCGAGLYSVRSRASSSRREICERRVTRVISSPIMFLNATANVPKRSNDFQKLVYLVRVNLAAGAIVTESKMLPDRKSKRKRKREVDVCIEGIVGGHPVMVCIECRDHKRPADVQWVEAIKAKHEGLPTSALILAS